MFEKLFTYPAAARRHRDGPLGSLRAEYLEGVAATGAAHGTLVRKARYCLGVAREIAKRPADYRFTLSEIDDLATAWAARRTAEGHSSSPRWPGEGFRSVATEFLQAIGRLCPRAAVVGPYENLVDDFISARREDRWLSEATCQSGRWQIGRFLLFLEQRSTALSDVDASHIDAYFNHMAARWGRLSLRTSATTLRAWLAHCEVRGWVRPRLAASVLLPRIYREEALPLGPTWEMVGRMLAATTGNESAQLRDHAILRLLSVYGLRSGEVRRLCLEDLDWEHDRMRVVRSKSGRMEVLALEPSVGNAIAQYLRHGRPNGQSRTVFLTLRAPYRPLSASGLYDVVRRHLPEPGSQGRGWGPHGLRHACARHLVESGRSFKEVGDHLGHRSPDATRIYAKVDLASLRHVALDDLGGMV